jgi:hypothetical protein
MLHSVAESPLTYVRHLGLAPGFRLRRWPFLGDGLKRGEDDNPVNSPGTDFRCRAGGCQFSCNKNEARSREKAVFYIQKG